MKSLNFLKPFIAFTFLIFMLSCSGSGNKNQQSSLQTQTGAKSGQVKINAEAQALLDYLNETGDYVNSRNFPSLIKASEVFKDLNDNVHIIDLRGPESYKEGHIKGAINVEFSDLPDYFANKINTSDYNKIIVVCYSGQISSYAVSLLRLMGYGNVYAMRWGMSGWNKDFAYQWSEHISSFYESQLESGDNEKSAASDLPLINVRKTDGEEIFNDRIKQLFEAGTEEAIILADKVFGDLARYYIINFIRKDKYESGHIPGAIRYKPEGTLSIISEMQTIPTDKNVVVYCETGHSSGFATAYLRLFGYNAHTLIYGSNSFMHDKMLVEKNMLSWTVFTDAEIEDFPYVK